MPLIKSKGNLIRFIKIITSDVMSVGFAATKRANKDPKIDIKIIPKNMKNTAASDINSIERIKMKTKLTIEVIIAE